MKKIIASFLSVALAFSSAAYVSAAEADVSSSTGLTFNDFTYDSRVIGEDTIPNHTARLYTFGKIGGGNNEFGIIFKDNATFVETECIFNSSVPYQDIMLTGKSYSSYKLIKYPTGGSMGSAPHFDFSESGGKYRKVRAKLSAFSNYFNSDGTYTKDGHKYNFTEEGNGYTSMLIICSGGMVTAVTPDRNGFVEFYCSSKIGVNTEFSTDYVYKTATSSSSGGGVSSQILNGFMVGDIDSDGNINIDDVTELQKYLADIIDVDDISIMNSDADNSGSIDIDDVTTIQKYLANML